MTDNPSMTFKVIDNEGNEVTLDILFTFDSPDTDRSYIVYTDNSFDEAGNVNVYAAIYNPKALEGGEVANAEDLQLAPIETEEEWKLVEGVFNSITEQLS